MESPLPYTYNSHSIWVLLNINIQHDLTQVCTLYEYAVYILRERLNTNTYMLIKASWLMAVLQVDPWVRPLTLHFSPA